MRKGFRIALVAAGVLAVCCVGLYLLTLHELRVRTLLPNSSHRPSPEPVTWIEAAPGVRIAAFYLSAPSEDTLTVLYSYGNLEELAGKKYLLERIHAMGYGAVGYDYEGFGSSDGEADIFAALRDADAVWEFLVNEAGVPEDRIVLAGFSMGAGPACYLASKHPAAGVFLECAFASLLQVVIPWSGWPLDPYDNESWLAGNRAPLLLLNAERDEVVASRNIPKLAAASAGQVETVTVPGAGHSNVREIMGDEAYFGRIGDFLERCRREREKRISLPASGD